MRLFRRLTNLMAANVHDWLDRWEPPEAMLKHIIRGMEEALAAAMREAAHVVAQQRLLTRELTATRTAVDAQRARAATAARAGRDDDARQALHRTRLQEQHAATLGRQIEEVEQLSRALRAQLDALRERLHEARLRQHVLVARRRAAVARGRLLSVVAGLPCASATEHEFERLARRVEEAEAEAEGLAELAAEATFAPPTLDADAAWIEQELAALKQQANS